MKNKIEYLEGLLKMKMNQHTMLSDTYYEMIKRDEPTSSLLTLKHEMDDTLGEINDIKFALEHERGGKRKPKPTNIYDSIQKKSEDEDPPLCKTIPIHERKKEKIENIVHKIFDEHPYDGLIFSNRFFADLEVLGIPSHMVRDVEYFADRNIAFKIYDFITEDGEPILRKLRLFANSERKFTFEVKHLDPTGVVLYKEKYNGGKVIANNIILGSLEYDKAEPRTIIFSVTYDGVNYI